MPVKFFAGRHPGKLSFMQDFVTIQTPEQAAQAAAQAAMPAKPASKGIEVTPRALDKIRSGMAKKVYADRGRGCVLGVLGGGLPGLSLQH